MKRLVSISASLLLVGAGLGVRAWLLNNFTVPTDDPPAAPKLTEEFDPVIDRIKLLRPVHEKKRPNQPGDWLERFPENGQSFAEYVRFRDKEPLNAKSTGIDIQPLGEFDETQQQMIAQTADFMGRFFGVPIRTLDSKPLEWIPEHGRRLRDDVEQVLTTWILDDRLRPARRPDAIATIGLVTCDLWPGNLNWVFGQASIADRIGVWSLHRNGDPRAGESAYRLCLRRTLKTAMHETGHMLGMPHCAAYECCMNGSRSREENDRQPLEFCPDCQAKIWWTCGADPVQRCKSLVEFCERAGMEPEAELFRKERDALR